VTLSDLAKYSMTRSCARSLRDSWATCSVHVKRCSSYRIPRRYWL